MSGLRTTSAQVFQPVRRIRTAQRLGFQSFGVIQVADGKTRTDSAYYFHNRRRPDGSGLVVQLTISGKAFYEDGEGRRLVPPDYAMLFSHSEDSAYGYPPESTEPYRHRYVEMTDCQALRNLFDRIVEDFGAIVHLPEGSDARDILNEIVGRFRVGRFRDRYEESELLHRFLIAIYRQQVDGTRIQDPIEFGYHYICNKFRNASNLKEIAHLCGVTREYFSRQFRQRYRQTPGQLLKRLRLEHAELLLRTTSMAIADISAASGFSGINTFERAFKRGFRLTPREFRDKARGSEKRHRPI